MDHLEFVKKYNDGHLKVHIDKNKAGFMYKKELMPRIKRLKQANLRALAFGGFFGGIILFFFVEWQIAFLILIFGMILFPQCQKLACKDVLWASLENDRFFQIAKSNGVLIIEE